MSHENAYRLSFCAIAAALIAVLPACDNGQIKPENKPSAVLEAYVKAALSVEKQEDIAKLEQFTTGNLRDEVGKLKTDKALFADQYANHVYRHDGFKIRDQRQTDPNRYSITYEVRYSDKKKETGIDDVIAKKNAIFVLENDRWLISEVQNLKTVVDHSTEENISGAATR